MPVLVRQFLMFSVVGAVGTCVHFLVLIILVKTHLTGAIIGSIFGFSAAAAINYLLNYHLTFTSTCQHLPTFFKFFAVALIGLCLNTLIMFFVTRVLHYLLSQIMATAIVLSWNFLSNRYWTFREVSLVRPS